MKISDERLSDLQHQYAGVYGIHGEVVNLCGEVLELRAEVTKLRDELEQERMRLAACGVVAMANTPESARAARDMHSDYRSASCDDVARIVDENMKLRSRVERAEALLRDAQTEIDGEDDWIEWVAKVGDHLREEK